MAPFRLIEPEALVSGAVFSSPHSGRAYFREFVSTTRLSTQALRASEDAYVDDLFAGAPTFGAPLLAATVPRAYVDLNRGPSDVDPSLVEGNHTRPANARVAAGLGVIPRIVAEGVPIYDRKLRQSDAQDRIAHWHAPYHKKLVELTMRARKQFGRAILIDCHSMPSGATSLGAVRHGRTADVVLGDRFGVSALPETVAIVEQAFVEAGFRVGRNAPFAGGYITERYGRPAMNVCAIQVEIDRGLYLDQTRIVPTAGFDALQRALIPVIQRICAIASSTEPRAVAAE
ncbi:MAG: N-formylglutamate amidohydrolase [Pseudomonadota bacterium]